MGCCAVNAGSVGHDGDCANKMVAIDDSLKRKIFEVLIRRVDASPTLINDFMYHWPKCEEFRIQGRLGFGGKVVFEDYYTNGPMARVTCYREDENPERRRLMNETTAELLELFYESGVTKRV